jgi:hypothetical protein
MTSTIRALLLILAAINVLFGIIALAQPRRVASWIGFELMGTGALGEFRSVYGGLVAVVGILIAVAVLMTDGGPLIGSLALVFAGLVVGRAVSLAVDGFATYTVAAGIFEAVGMALLFTAWWRPDGL